MTLDVRRPVPRITIPALPLLSNAHSLLTPATLTP